MPLPPPPRTPSGPRRRTLLASVAGAVSLVGCSTGCEDSGGGTDGGPSVVERARARAARDSLRLVERYDAVLLAHPALAERLKPLRAETVRHTEAFGGSGRAPAPPSSAPPSPSAASPGAAAASQPPAAVPGTEQAALAELAAAERSLADRRAKALLDVEGELARLLASVAAAGAAHAYLLTEDAK